MHAICCRLKRRMKRLRRRSMCENRLRKFNLSDNVETLLETREEFWLHIEHPPSTIAASNGRAIMHFAGVDGDDVARF